MIGLDLDGTLLTDRKEITPRTRRVISRAIEEGVVVLVATGRPWMGVPEELREFPGMRYALTSNGARILDVQEGVVLEEHLLPPDSAKKALRICGKYDTLQEIYFDGQGYAPAEKMAKVERYHKNPNMWEYMRKTRIPVDDISEFLERENRGLDKVQALFADMEEREAAWRELEREPDLELVGSLRYNIEINAAGVNKGTGLVNLGRLLGIRREEIMACGDGDNDTVMLREAGFGVAMGNAEEYVKRVEDNTIMDVLQRYDVNEGDVFFLPAGRVHAIGAGCFIAEIQQTSNITYRIYDYNRKDANGNGRELHTELAKDAIDYTLYPDYRTHYKAHTNATVELADCKYFTTNLIEIDATMTRDFSELDSFVVYICMGGSAVIKDDKGNEVNVHQGQTVLIPADTKSVSLIPAPNAKFMETYIK